MSILINLLSKTDLWALPVGRHQDGLGLSLLVSKQGRSWSLNGNRGLGGLRKVTLEQARQRRDILLAAALNEPDRPMPSAPILRAIPSFLERAKEVIATETEGLTGAKLDRAKRNWERSLLHFAKPLHDRKVDAVETEDVVAVLKPIWLVKKPTAKMTRRHIAKVFSSCRADKFIISNPAALEDNLEHKLQKQRHKVRHHPAMPHADVAAYVHGLIETGTLSALALAFTIVTCVRTMETLTARWDDIDKTGVWSVRSGEEMKNGLFARVPLTAQAQMILRAVRAKRAKRARVMRDGQQADDAGFIFPGMEDGHLCRHAMLKQLKSTHRHLSVHGFRASFKSWGMKFQIDRDTIEYCLHHIEGSRTEQAYMREECLEERREVLGQWAAYCMPSKLRLVA
jgi:integrase